MSPSRRDWLGPAELVFHSFGKRDPLALLKRTKQGQYLRCYLKDLGAVSVVEEPHYFDRDYLAEFSAFYSTSARGYSNVCGRLHFFKGARVDRDRLSAALEDPNDAKRLNDDYLGFVVLRPIPSTLGRTVLCWYPEQKPLTPRVVEPSRDYRCHLAGLELKVTGLAWQQQDSGVGACATVAMWTMLHSSAFDDSHAIPTTAKITEFAHRTASLGSRVFPSTGLNVHQLCEAIKESGLAPVLVEGDLQRKGGGRAFSKTRFLSSCAALIRSGYPALLLGRLGERGHAVCAVGFREAAPPRPRAGRIELQDGQVEHLYIHDDNLGPSVRFRVSQGGRDRPTMIVPDPPEPQYKGARLPDPTVDYAEFMPTVIVAAVHEDMRTSPDALHLAGLEVARKIALAFRNRIGLTVSARFSRLWRYVDAELGRTLSGAPAGLLARVRLALWEKVPPMSLHVGVVRIGRGSTPLMDVLYDTTDSDRNLPAFCHVAYQPQAAGILLLLHNAGLIPSPGPLIEAF